MATKVYDSKQITLLDGNTIEIVPVKIKYLRELMDEFENIKNAKNDTEAMDVLLRCAFVAMKQYYPQAKTIEDVEDLLDMHMVYDILEYAANIKVNGKNEESKTIKEQTSDTEKGAGWSELDLAKLEAEVFLLGIWKDYQELELSLSMPELMMTLSSHRELDYQEKKFLAAMQGVDLEKNNKQNEWENLKARVFSKGKTSDGNDVLALQGATAKKAGFGIGMGLDYEDLTQK
jgi:hypothetical protein